MEITFKLFDVSKDFKIATAEAEINLSYRTRFKCEVVYEKYARQKDFVIIEIEINGDDNQIIEATKESEFIFSKYSRMVIIHR